MEKLKNAISKGNCDLKSMIKYLNFSIITEYDDGFDNILSHIISTFGEKNSESLAEEICLNIFFDERYFEKIFSAIKLWKRDTMHSFVKYSCIFGNGEIISFLKKNNAVDVVRVGDKFPIDFLMEYGVSIQLKIRIKKENFFEILKILTSNTKEIRFDKNNIELYKIITTSILNKLEITKLGAFGVDILSE